VTESEIWQIIQSGNEISVMRTELFITVTVGVLLISTIDAIRLTKSLLSILLSTYLIFGYINFTMLVGEMEILVRGITQLKSMADTGADVSFMGHSLVDQLDSPIGTLLLPGLHLIFWTVSLSTITYSVWRYLKQQESARSPRG
jgi:hypothetical protein